MEISRSNIAAFVEQERILHHVGQRAGAIVLFVCWGKQHADAATRDRSIQEKGGRRQILMNDIVGGRN